MSQNQQCLQAKEVQDVPRQEQNDKPIESSDEYKDAMSNLKKLCDMEVQNAIEMSALQAHIQKTCEAITVQRNKTLELNLENYKEEMKHNQIEAKLSVLRENEKKDLEKLECLMEKLTEIDSKIDELSSTIAADKMKLIGEYDQFDIDSVLANFEPMMEELNEYNASLRRKKDALDAKIETLTKAVESETSDFEFNINDIIDMKMLETFDAEKTEALIDAKRKECLRMEQYLKQVSHP